MDKIITNIEINISEMMYGIQTIHLKFDDLQIVFRGSYLGECPLSSLISLVAEIDSDIENEDVPNDMTIKWLEEPGALAIYIKYDGKIDYITIKVTDEDLFAGGEIKNPKEVYHVIVDHESFRNSIIKEASRMLKTFGLRGYNGNWADGIDNFPVSAFLRLLGNKSEFDDDSDTYKSSLGNEIALLKSIL